ncbi:MAG: GldG family protein [Chthoniobacterales bacterium]
MNKKPFETYLYSTIGIVAVALILIALNFIAGRARARVDLTAEKAYTLSPGTKAILAKLDTPVQLRFYCTKNTANMPVFLTNYAQRIDDLLTEYRQASKGQIEIQRLNPEPDSDAEDSARLDGIEPQQLRAGDRLYLGLSIAMLDQKQAIPFLTPDRERLLEYDISRAIARVATPEKPVVGVMSALPVMGQTNPMMRRNAMQQQQPPWAFISELKRDFNVKQIEMTATEIPADVKTLIVIHPKGIQEAAQYAIDQFVLRGGKLVAFVDPLAILDRPPMQTSTMPPQSSSTLDTLFKAWGVGFDATKVVADLEHAARVEEGPNPAVLALNETAVNKDDVVTADADNLVMAFSGAFTGTPAEGLTRTVLLQTSKRSGLADPMMAAMSGPQLASEITQTGTEYPVAIRLTGKFKSAFPQGKPQASPTPAPSPNEQKPPENPPSENSLKESAQPTTVVLVGDADMLQDQLSVREIGGMGQRMVMPINSNLSLAQGVVEQLAGDSNLIAVRSRASRERPFTVVQKMQADAEASYRSKIKELETSLADTQRKVNDLQRAKEGNQRFILSPEQQTELANFRKTEADVKGQLKTMRRQLRASIDSLENRLKWINIAGMPLAVIVVGLIFTAVKRKRTAAV